MFRLDDKLLTKLNRLGKLERKDLSTIIKELLEEAKEIKEKYYKKYEKLLAKDLITKKNNSEEKSDE